MSLACLVFLMLPSVNGSYWFLTALSTQMNMLMYVILFLCGIVSHYRLPHKTAGFRIPGGAAGMWLVCLCGFAGCLLTEVVGFMPPSLINIGSVMRYELMFVSAMVAIVSPVFVFWLYQSRQLKHKK